MSYKGCITCSTVNVYKRGKSTSSIPEGKLDFGYFEYHVGEFEKVVPDLNAYSVLYYGDDVEQKHPVYRLNNPTDTKLQIDLGGEKVSTLLINDDKYVNMSDGETYSDRVIGFGFYPEGNQNFGYNFKAYSENVTGAVPVNDRYNKYKSGTAERMYWDVTGCALYRTKKNYEEYFVNGDIDGLTAYYKPDLDCMIAPGFNPNTQMVDYFSITGTKVYMKSSFRGFNSNVANSLIASGFATNRYVPAYGQFQLLNDTGEYTTFYPPIFCDPAVPLNFIAGNATVDSRYTAKTIPFFLKDKQGEYWLMYTIYGAVYGDRNLVQDNGYRDVILMKVKDMPTTYLNNVNDITTANPSSIALTWITSAEYADPKTIDDVLDLVFSVPDRPNYSDDGPDAIGPGDPYEDENNAGEAVGGDANIVDDITPPNMAPNTSYENYVIDNGLYGSYKLTTANLRNYTKTLQLCRDSAWIPGKLGDKFENMGNLIKENTVSVFMLPVDIEETTLVPFNVGTKAIRNTDTVGNWGQPSSVDTTSLINKYTKEYEYDLGTISHYYDNFLDFAPYSTASLYIPYIGKVEIPINLVQSTSTDQKQLSLSIRLNRTNGDILCILLSNNIPLCRWQGNCARSIALSVNDNSAILQNQFSRLVSSFSSGLSALGAAATGNVGGATSNLGQMFAAPVGSGAPITTSSHMIGNAPETGDVGWMDSQLITLTVERPIWWKPYDYGNLIGYPTRKIAKLATVSGFAKVPNIHIRCSATESEKERLKTMLAEGVLF